MAISLVRSFPVQMSLLERPRLGINHLNFVDSLIVAYVTKHWFITGLHCFRALLVFSHYSGYDGRVS